LVVEDERMVRELFRRVLQGQGYTVLEAENGVQALQLAEQNLDRIDLLLTDMIMPRLGGRELARRLAHLRPGLKVLYVSGYADEAVALQGVFEPGTDYLQKPFL